MSETSAAAERLWERELADAKGASYPTVVAEIVKATLFGEKVPRSIPPAPSRRMAADFLSARCRLTKRSEVGYAPSVNRAEPGALITMPRSLVRTGASDRDVAAVNKAFTIGEGRSRRHGRTFRLATDVDRDYVEAARRRVRDAPLFRCAMVSRVSQTAA